MLTSAIFVPTGFFSIHWTKWELISKISLYLKLECTFWIVCLDKERIVFRFIHKAFTIEVLANKKKETYDCRTMIISFVKIMYTCYGTYLLLSNRSYKTILERTNSSLLSRPNGIFHELQEGIVVSNKCSIFSLDMDHLQVLKHPSLWQYHCHNILEPRENVLIIFYYTSL